MALLASHTVSVVAGATYVPFPVGVTLSTILCVKREGLQHDQTTNALINDGNTRQWAADVIRRRIKFPAAIPFNAGEKIFIITKPIV